jgi:hypothetical protein
MPRKIDKDFDKEVLNYLQDHTWKQTQDNFEISSRTIKNMRERNSVSNEIESKVISKVVGIPDTIKKDIKIMIELFHNAFKIKDFQKLLNEDVYSAEERLNGVIE